MDGTLVDGIPVEQVEFPEPSGFFEHLMREESVLMVELGSRVWGTLWRESRMMGRPGDGLYALYK